MRATGATIGETFKPLIPATSLRDVLQDFRIRHYPTFLRIGEYIEDWALTDGYDEKRIQEREHEFAKAQEAASDCVPLIIKEVVGCPFIRAAKQGEWTRRILEGQRDEVFAKLLILLPNLATIEIQGSFHSAFRIMLKKIAHAYPDPEKKYPLVLTRLTNALVAPNNETDSDGPWESSAALGPFAALPSIRSLSGSFVVSGGPDEEDAFEWSYPSRISELTELTIKYSNVYGSSGPRFLSGIKSLQRFTYSRGGFLDDGRSSEPRRIIAALKRYASRSLEHLYISGARINVDADLNDKQDCSLRAFEKLRHIHVEHYLFCSVADKLDKLDHELSDSRTPQRPVDMLPASVETLEIEGDISTDHEKAVFAGFKELKEEWLPKLTALELQGPAFTKDSIVDLC